MPTGTVKWFNNAKGYGFILADEGGEDLFAHYSAIQMDGYRTLKAGQQVTFDIVKGEKGYHAANISTVIPNESASGEKSSGNTGLSSSDQGQVQREKEAEALD
ncbi:cold shock domain-containing protein CspD [Microbulbifer thermotolerans]|uniref:Cold shock-like protein CspD n=1 Tax=Microbulbifer thermotolerans TaxID=252514 RepID=A0A143HLD5_MICTH|nr:cold shock domain-containing protein CspD [Microbulbifer thermotolerans]AMX02535.1 cold-shock protein [Microbulbifer thermotolerans]WKT62176.1 cold shock domain-containing protein CspD [Microbulbifer thermotolerans]SFB84131.1 cold shock protein (beta-ribbon, CspA family) [Microbulbifer thermotolerans]